MILSLGLERLNKVSEGLVVTSRSTALTIECDDPRLADLVDAITVKLQAGQPIELAHYAVEFPEYAERLENWVAALKAIVDLGESFSQAGPRIGRGSPDPAHPASNIEHPTSSFHILGDFRIIHEIGRGGMGVVYEAEQISLKRRVALKVLPFAAVLEPRQLARFQHEAQAAAMLKHPNIVAVHAVGSDRGVHFYAMELVEGWSLAEVLEQARGEKDVGRSMLDVGSRQTSNIQLQTSNIQHPASSIDTQPIAALSTLSTASPKERYRHIARLGIQAAEALHYAHEMGIVHRDIKPSNLLVDAHGHLWVTDFGLATTQTDAGLTMSGDLLGTLRYMSPEQAAGDRAKIDYHTDIYSLGITLYELIAGRPAFPDSDRGKTLRSIIDDDPPPPRNIRGEIPRDLETIVLKAIAKEPLGRYDSARALADDLKRYLEQRPILARRATRRERLRQWSRRNPALALVTSSACALLLVLAIGGTLAAWREHRLNENLRLQEYVASIGLASTSLQLGKTERAREILEKYTDSDLVGFEWHFLKAACERSRMSIALRPDPPVWLNGGTVRDVAFSPDGKQLAAAHWSNNVKLWDLASRTVIKTLPVVGKPTSVAFNAQGTRLAAVTEADQVHVWEIPSAIPLKTIDHTGASGSGEKTNHCQTVAYSRDGALAACFQNGDVCIWNAAQSDIGNDLALKYTISSEHARHDVEFSPDGKLLFAADNSGSIVAYTANDGHEQFRLKGFDSPALALAFSPNGELLAASSKDQSIKVWDLKQQRLLHTLLGHTDLVDDVKFSPDSKVLASASYDNSIKLWEAADGREITTLWGHAGHVWGIAFSPEGGTLASGATDDAIRIWNLSRAQSGHIAAVESPIRCVWDLAFSQRADFIAAAGDGDEIWIGDTHSSQALHVLTGQSRYIHAIDLSQDDRLLIIGGGATNRVGARRPIDQHGIADFGNISVWDLDTMKEVAVTRGHDSRVIGIKLWANDRYALSVATDGAVKLWQVPQLQELKVVRPPGVPCYSAALSPDQSWLALGTEQGSIELWRYRSDGWSLWHTLPGHADWILCMQFSRDSRLLASASLDQTAAIWGIASGRLEHRLRGQGWVNSVDFAADGKTLATGHADSSVRLWNVSSGAELLTLRGHSNQVNAVRFSPDGSMLVSGQAGGTIRFWRTR
jgi:WD40 repeat protein/serine/threonine protein kinase